jgi:hypothetical protein
MKDKYIVALKLHWIINSFGILTMLFATVTFGLMLTSTLSTCSFRGAVSSSENTALNDTMIYEK